MIEKDINSITDEERRKFFGLKEGEGEGDPFYSKESMLWHMKSLEQLKNGQVVTVTFDELKEMLDG